MICSLTISDKQNGEKIVCIFPYALKIFFFFFFFFFCNKPTCNETNGCGKGGKSNFPLEKSSSYSKQNSSSAFISEAPGWLSRLRIPCCHFSGLGHCCRGGLIPGPGISTYCGCGHDLESYMGSSPPPSCRGHPSPSLPELHSPNYLRGLYVGFLNAP